MKKAQLLSILILAMAALGFISGCASMRELTLRSELARANEAFEHEEFALAASRYESLSDRYPDSLMRERLMFNQGMSLYKISSFNAARDAFVKYVNEYPSGRYVADARDYLRKIDVYMSMASPAQAEAIEQAKADLVKLNQLKIEHPNDPKVFTALGNLYWEMGDYNEAVRNYYEATSLDAAYKEKELIKGRMMITAKGEAVPITPEQLKKAEADANPVVVFNLHEYKSRDTEEFLGGNKRYFNVTGMARNQGSKPLANVEIEVVFNNSQHQVQDSKVVRVGAMAPGDVRAFRAEASSYDNLYNITSYNCIPHWTN
ncbi:MAG: FxLYD domain-containing protein [bacterium]|nr:FxLYD domain-containing protein [bacterium]